MASASHTPGPWETRLNGMFLRVAHGKHKITVADGIVSEANARLIAAAPNLLEALIDIDKSWAETFEHGPDHDYGSVAIGEEHRAFWVKARAAIAKATGAA